MAKTKRWFRSGLVAGAVLFGSFALVMTQQGAREGGGGAPIVRSDIVVSVLTQGTSTPGTSVTTASVAPDPDCLVVAAVENAIAAATTPTASGNGLTYVEIDNVVLNGSARRITAFRAMGATPSAGVITFDFGVQDQTSVSWGVLQFCGVDTSGTNGAGAVLQNTKNTATAATSIEGTLAALEHANNVAVSITGGDLGTVLTTDADWAERTNQTNGSGAHRIVTATALAQTVSTTAAAASVDLGILMLEIRAGGGEGVAGISLTEPWDRFVAVPGVTGAGNFDGADGVDVRDINGDGLPDMVSGSEQGGRLAVALHPGEESVTSEWGSVIVPTTALTGPEDAIFFDVDVDGRVDAIAGLEGGRRITVLYAPDPGDLLTAAEWTTVNVDASTAEGHRVMRVAAADLDGDGTVELVAGAKENDNPAEQSYIRVYSSSTPRVADSWTGEDVVQVGWTKQLLALDMDDDDDIDLVWSDGALVNFPEASNAFAGIWWAENDGTGGFSVHEIVGAELAWEWFSVVDWDANGELDVVGCRSNASFSESSIWLSSSGGTSWSELVVTQPNNTGECQHATAVDVDQDGDLDLAFSYNHADPDLSGVVWLRRSGPAAAPVFQRGEIAGTADGTGIKFDNLVWIDIDGDGDLDAVTSEQHEPDATGPGLGLIWYRNPAV